MARAPRSRVALLLIAVALTACSGLGQARTDMAGELGETVATVAHAEDAPEEVAEAPPADESGQGRVRLFRVRIPAMWLLGLGLLVGGAVGLLVGRHLRPSAGPPPEVRRSHGPPSPPTPEAPTMQGPEAVSGAAVPVTTDRDPAVEAPMGAAVPAAPDPGPAIEAAIAAWDVADERHRGHLERILNHLDVHRFSSDGERFDPDRHHTLSVRPSQSVRDDMRVAATVRVGWHHDDGRIMRPAEVEVWQHASTPSHAPDSA